MTTKKEEERPHHHHQLQQQQQQKQRASNNTAADGGRPAGRRAMYNTCPDGLTVSHYARTHARTLRRKPTDQPDEPIV